MGPHSLLGVGSEFRDTPPEQIEVSELGNGHGG